MDRYTRTNRRAIGRIHTREFVDGSAEKRIWRPDYVTKTSRTTKDEHFASFAFQKSEFVFLQEYCAVWNAVGFFLYSL